MMNDERGWEFLPKLVGVGVGLPVWQGTVYSERTLVREVVDGEAGRGCVGGGGGMGGGGAGGGGGEAAECGVLAGGSVEGTGDGVCGGSECEDAEPESVGG